MVNIKHVHWIKWPHLIEEVWGYNGWYRERERSTVYVRRAGFIEINPIAGALFLFKGSPNLIVRCFGIFHRKTPSFTTTEKPTSSTQPITTLPSTQPTTSTKKAKQKSNKNDKYYGFCALLLLVPISIYLYHRCLRHRKSPEKFIRMKPVTNVYSNVMESDL